MTTQQKQSVRDALLKYVGNFETQTLAAESLQGISSSTISQVRNNNWELLSDRLWHHIARQVGFYVGEWQPADTGAYLLLRILYSDAQKYCMTYGIAMASGLGKTFTASHYARENDNTYLIQCEEGDTRKSILMKMLSQLGSKEEENVPIMMQRIVAAMSSKEEPLIIFDDTHKLKDRVLHMIVQLSNMMSGSVGVVIQGSPDLRTKIVDGVKLKKVGYDDIYKAIGRRFITLGTIGPKDVELVCRANGLYNDVKIDEIKQIFIQFHGLEVYIKAKLEEK